MTAIEIPPGMTSARHRHPGEDFGYVIEGTIVRSQCPQHWGNRGEGGGHLRRRQRKAEHHTRTVKGSMSAASGGPHDNIHNIKTEIIDLRE